MTVLSKVCMQTSESFFMHGNKILIKDANTTKVHASNVIRDATKSFIPMVGRLNRFVPIVSGRTLFFVYLLLLYSLL